MWSMWLNDNKKNNTLASLKDKLAQNSAHLINRIDTTIQEMLVHLGMGSLDYACMHVAFFMHVT